MGRDRGNEGQDSDVVATRSTPSQSSGGGEVGRLNSTLG